MIAAALLFYPVLGNLRPDKVSFLPSMRQYSGNWASALWAFTPGAEAKLNRVTRAADNQGTWRAADAVAEQPWLPNGPISTQVTWIAPQREHHTAPA